MIKYDLVVGSPKEVVEEVNKRMLGGEGWVTAGPPFALGNSIVQPMKSYWLIGKRKKEQEGVKSGKDRTE